MSITEHCWCFSACNLGYKADVQGQLWSNAPGYTEESAGPSPEARPSCELQFNSPLPVGTQMVRLTDDKGRNSCLGRDHGNQFDWDAIASGAGDPRAAELLQRVCNRTKWRKSMGKQCTEFPQFTATGTSGRMVGSLGDNLASATVNLVASGQHDMVNTW